MFRPLGPASLARRGYGDPKSAREPRTCSTRADGKGGRHDEALPPQTAAHDGALVADGSCSMEIGRGGAEVTSDGNP